MGELQETIGTAVLPIMGTLATVLTGTVLPALTTVFGWIMDHKDLIVAALIAVAVVITATLGPAFVTWAVAAAAAATATLLAAAPFIALGAVIAGVAYIIIHNWDTIVEASKRVWEIIRGAVETAFNWVKDNWPLLLAIITGPIGAAVLIVVRNWDSIKAAAQTVWDWINNTWSSLVGIISGPIQTAKDLVVGAWDAIKGAATDTYNWIKEKFDAIGGAIEAVIGAITTAVGKVVSAIKAPINAVIGAWNNISFTIPAVSTPKVHVPGTNIDFGGEIYGGHTFDFPNLPTLAAGGVLTSPTLFFGGEAGTEIVAPEELLRRIVADETGGGHYTLNMYPRTADAADVAYAFRRLELMAGIT
jgi:phage-related protein